MAYRPPISVISSVATPLSCGTKSGNTSLIFPSSTIESKFSSVVGSSACTGIVFIMELRITNAVRKNLLPFFNMFFIFIFLSFILLQQKRRENLA